MTFCRERNALQSEHSAAQEGGDVHLSEHFYLQVWLPSLPQIQLLAYLACIPVYWHSSQKFLVFSLLFLSRSSFCASVSEARFAAFLLCLASSEAFVFALSCIVKSFTVTLVIQFNSRHMD